MLSCLRATSLDSHVALQFQGIHAMMQDRQIRMGWQACSVLLLLPSNRIEARKKHLAGKEVSRPRGLYGALHVLVEFTCDSVPGGRYLLVPTAACPTLCACASPLGFFCPSQAQHPCRRTRARHNASGLKL